MMSIFEIGYCKAMQHMQPRELGGWRKLRLQLMSLIMSTLLSDTLAAATTLDAAVTVERTLSPVEAI